MYGRHHFICIALCGLGINTSTRHVADKTVMGAVALVMVARSIEGHEEWYTIGNDTPGLQNRKSLETLVNTDKSELTAVKDDRSKAILTLAQNSLNLFAGPIPTTFWPFDGNSGLRPARFLSDTLEAAPQLAKQPQMPSHSPARFNAPFTVNALPRAAAGAGDAEPYERASPEQVKNGNDSVDRSI